MNRHPTKGSNQKQSRSYSLNNITNVIEDTIPTEKNSNKNIPKHIWHYSQKNVATKKIILSQSCNNSFRFIGFNNWTNNVIDLIKSGNCIYEDYLVCKPYIDYEYKVDFKLYTLNKKEHDRIAFDRMKSIVSYIKYAMIDLTNDVDTDFEIKVTKSHGSITINNDSEPDYHKYSFHFVVNSKYRFRNSCDAKQLIITMESNQRCDKDITKFIDKNVYKVNKKSYQKMRCIYSRKTENDQRVLEPIDCDTGRTLSSDDVLITDYIISHCSSSNNNNNDNSNENDIVFLKENINTNIVKTITKTNNVQKANKITNPIIVPNVDTNTDTDTDTFSSTNEEKELLIMIRKIVKSAYFISSKTDESNVTFHTYDYNHTEKCIHGSIHDRINGYVCRNGFNVFAGCFSDKCKNLKTKKIGTLNMFNENWTKLENVTNFNTNYIPNDDVMKQINDFMLSTSKEDKLLGIKSGMNTGKTQCGKSLLNTYFNNYDGDRRILTFSTRQAYSKDVVNNSYKNLNFANYLDVKDKTTLVEKNRLIISLESLHKLYESKSDLKTYDVIILDECESLLTHFFSSTVKSNRWAFDNFVELLKHAKKIICLDADMSIARSIAFLKSIANKVTIFKNEFKQARRKFRCINNFSNYYSRISRDINEGKNVCVVSTSRDHGLQLRDMLQKDFPNIADQIKFIYGQCDKSLKDQLGDVNSNWVDYKVLIYNTVIAQGVNFDVKDHFHSIYVYVTGHLCSAKEIMQMIGRIRFPIDIDILCLIDNKVSKKTNNIVYSLDYAHKYCHTLLTDIPVDTLKMYYKDEHKNTCVHSETVESIWNILRASYVQEHLLNNSSSNIMTTFKMLIESNGDIYEEDYDAEIPKMDSKTYFDRIIEADILTMNENMEVCKKDRSDLTEKDLLNMKKYQLKHKQNLKDSTPDEIVNECITTYIKNEKEIETVIRINKKVVDNVDDNLKSVRKKDAKDTEDELIIEKQKHFKSAYDKTVKALDFEYSNETKTFEDDDFNERFKNIEYTRSEILSLDTRGRMIDKYQIVKTILSRYGIIFRNDTKRVYINKKQVRVKFYILLHDQPMYEIMHNIVTNNSDSYNDDFIDMIKSYNKYNNYLLQPKINQNKSIAPKSLFVIK